MKTLKVREILFLLAEDNSL